MLRHVLPRAGYAAMGLVYATVGLVAARIAFLGARDRVAGVHGALAVLMRQTQGRWILTGVAAGLACFAVWRAMQTFSARGDLITRAGWAITAIGYGALAWTGIALLLRFPRGDNFERIGIGRLLPYPAGRLALRTAAAILIVTGIIAVIQGASGRLPRWLAGPGFRNATRRLARPLARIGLAARGIVAVVMGYFLMRAVADFNPREAREVGGSLRVLSQSPGGPFLMGTVALGLVSYGIAMWAVALARRPA
jgi:hypothetical protein